MNTTGSVCYRNVLPSAMADRAAWDGTVPAGVSCTGSIRMENTGGSSAEGSVVFCLIGQAGDNAIGSAGSLMGLGKQVGVKIKDFWLVSSNPYYDVRVSVAVGDPSAFPDNASMHLYDCDVVDDYEGKGVVKVKVPDIEGLLITGNTQNPLNVCVRVTARLSPLGIARVSFHSVCIVDD